MNAPTTLNALLPHELAGLVPEISESEARKLVALAHRCGELPLVTPSGIRRVVFEQIRERLSVPHLELVDEQQSSLDPFVKYGFRAPDGSVIEAVRIPLEHPQRFSVCVSSQVGCGVGCTFCGTARLGFARNLAAWEIVDQVRSVRQRLPEGKRVHGVVFQGMGEPLANLANVLRAIRVFWEPSCMAIDATNVTVCSSGMPARLETLTKEEPRVRIALSIGSAIRDKRAQLIPAERSHPLSRSLEVLAAHTRETRHSPLFAYTLLRGVNDTDADIAALADLIEDFVQQCGVKPRVSLIPYSPLGVGESFQPSTEDRIDAFRTYIGSRSVPILRRYSGGADIEAACGQLGLRYAAGRPGGAAPAR